MSKTSPIPLAPLRAFAASRETPIPSLTHPPKATKRLRQSIKNHVNHLNHVKIPSCPAPAPLRVRPFRLRPRSCPPTLRTHRRPIPSPSSSKIMLIMLIMSKSGLLRVAASQRKPIPLAPFAPSRLRARLLSAGLPNPTQSPKAARTRCSPCAIPKKSCPSCKSCPNPPGPRLPVHPPQKKSYAPAAKAWRRNPGSHPFWTVRGVW